MDLNYSDEDLAFREEVRAFLAELPPELREKNGAELGKEGMERWHEILNDTCKHTLLFTEKNTV